MTETSTTFGNWKDRLTFVFAEAQLLVGGIMFSLAAALLIFKPNLPGVPPIVVGWIAALLLLGPPVFGFFVWFVRWLRRRNRVECHQANAYRDKIEKYYVKPEVWADKNVDGPNPYPVNGGSAWGVQEFDWDEELEQLTVKGVWLEETQDVKLLTSKSHMQSIYNKLTESHIALGILRDSVSEFGGDIQHRLINKMAEAREQGKMMDQEAVKDVFESFKGDAEDHGPEDLPTLEPDQEETDPALEEIGADEPGLDMEEMADEAAADAVATDGGDQP